MKTKLATLVSIFLLFSIGLYAQKSKSQNKVYKVWVSKVDNSKMSKGILYEVNDESLTIIDRNSIEISVDASNIGLIKIRKKGKIGNGVLIGALTGFATGGIIGLVSGDEPDKTVDGGWLFGTYTVKGEQASDKALLYGVSLAFVGGGAGAILASKKNIISINGDINNNKNILDILKSYTMSINN